MSFVALWSVVRVYRSRIRLRPTLVFIAVYVAHVVLYYLFVNGVLIVYGGPLPLTGELFLNQLATWWSAILRLHDILAISFVLYSLNRDV